MSKAYYRLSYKFYRCHQYQSNTLSPTEKFLNSRIIRLYSDMNQRTNDKYQPNKWNNDFLEQPIMVDDGILVFLFVKIVL